MQTILQRQVNMVKVAKEKRSDSSENARNRSEILRGPTKKNFRQIAWKLTELEQFQFSEKPQSYPEVTPRLPWSYPEVTPRLPWSYLEVTPKLPQGYPDRLD